MPAKSAKVDDYIAKAAPFAQPVLEHLRAVVHDACPSVEEAWKWNFPNFLYKGAILCTMSAFKEHCSFGFWKGSLLSDPDKLLPTTGKTGMGHLGKITSLSDLPSDEIMKKYIKEAMRLNDEGVKLPPKTKATAPKDIAVPGYFTEALEASEKAKLAFNQFPYSHKKEYIEWFEDAKTEATRNKRVAQALQWLEEGKSRNWKYQ